jgi:hypothetical protein
MLTRLVRMLVPSVALGAWAGAVCHRYLGNLGESMHAWPRNGAFDTVTTLAVAAGVAFAIVLVVDGPASHWLPRAHVRPRALRAQARAPVLAASMLLLALADSKVPALLPSLACDTDDVPPAEPEIDVPGSSRDTHMNLCVQPPGWRSAAQEHGAERR